MLRCVVGFVRMVGNSLIDPTAMPRGIATFLRPRAVDRAEVDRVHMPGYLLVRRRSQFEIIPVSGGDGLCRRQSLLLPQCF